MGWVDREERGEIHGNERGREGREGEREREVREERHKDRESEEMKITSWQCTYSKR